MQKLAAMFFLGVALTPAHAQLADADCDQYIRLEAASKTVGGELGRVKSGPPSDGNALTCSYVRKGKEEKVGIALNIYKATKRTKDIDLHKMQPQRNGKVEEDLEGIGERAVYYTETPATGKGWSSLPERGVKGVTARWHIEIRIQRAGGDEAAMKKYLLETAKHVADTAP